MFLIGHAAVGATIVQFAGIENPALAFGVGWLSHYVADFVPHGDEPVGKWTEGPHGLRRLLAIVALDGILLLLALGAVFARRGFSWAVLAASAGACVPDVLWGLEKLAGRKLFGPHGAFHFRNHNYFHVNLPLGVGLALQGAVTALLFWRLAAV